MFKQIFRLCKLQMCNMFGINEFVHTRDKSKRKRFVLMMSAWAIVIIMLISYVVGLSYGLIKLGMSDVLPMYLYAVVSILMLVFTFFKAGSVIFSTKGYEMLITLPMSETSIVVSRFMTMYLSNVLMSCLVMIPGGIVYGIMEGGSFVFYAIYVTSMIFLPLLPLTVASIIGAVITAISSRMRRKSIAQALITIALILVIFGSTMVLPKENESISIESLKNAATMVKEQIGAFYPPALWFNNAVFGEFEYVFAYIGIPLVIFVVFVVVLQNYFKRICTMLNGVSSKNNYELHSLKSQGVVKALWKKELKRYFASSIYVTNTIIGYILAVVAAVSLCIVGIEKVEALIGVSGIQPILELVLPFIYAVLMTIATTTSCSISMEGKNFWMLQTLPIRSNDIYLAKMLANLTIALPFYVISVAVGFLTIQPDIMEYLWIIIIPACYIVYMSVIGIKVNIAFPSFNWDNEVQVVKQSASTFVSMIVGVVSSVVPAVIVGVLGKENGNISRGVIVLLLVGLTVVFYNKNKKMQIKEIG